MDIQWPLVVFSLLAGCGGATIAFIGISEILGVGKKARIPAAILAIVLLIIGGCASVLHLGQPANIMAAAANVFSFSGISVELIALGMNVVVAVVYLLLARGGSESGAKIVAIVGIVTGLAMTFFVGNGYVMESQPNWNNITLPLAYLGSGLSCGATLFAALAGNDEKAQAKLRNLVLGSIAIALITFVAYAASTGFAANAMMFWVGAVLVGCVGPAACVWFSKKRYQALWAAFACAFIGGICLRATMWMLGTGFLSLFATASSRMLLGA